jgi:two-component system, cell cycle sensor histidine kinase and response regulator CckA
MSQPSDSVRTRPGRPAATPHLPDLRQVRLLIVDDDPQAAALIDIALADAPFECTIEVVSSLAAGLPRIRSGEHDVYLIDQLLPDGTGIELIQRAKAEGASRPFILLTGYGSGALDQAASRQGAADYVEKHLIGSHLERSIRYAIRTWQAHRALLEQEEQLRQAHKMEAVGRLAGGVAHDFNNLLTAIVGFTERIAERLEAGEPVATELREIRAAAERGAALTSQLLTFSRGQILEPRVVDLSAAVSDILNMLPRLLGARICTTAHLTADAARVRAGAGQLEQVIVNVALNARDAMPDGGHLTFETRVVTLDEPTLADRQIVLAPGRYVELAIRDTGVGMDADTQKRAFEPFFTTKPRGKGTGLGLATVYGIVDQGGGATTLESTPEQGTTVRIYLPATDDPVDPSILPAPSSTPARGSETLLVVEDNDPVREIAVTALERRGYRVFAARNGEEALGWAASGVRPHLLVTDIVMPGVSGIQLAEQMRQLQPNLRVLFISGYPDDVPEVPPGGRGTAHLQKPFTSGTLADRVRTILDSADTGA